MTGSNNITVLASGNLGKLKELQAAMLDTGLKLQPKATLPYPRRKKMV